MRISSSPVFVALYLGFAATTAISHVSKIEDRDIHSAGKRDYHLGISNTPDPEVADGDVDTIPSQ